MRQQKERGGRGVRGRLPERRVEVGLELRCRVELLWLDRLSRMIGRRHMVGCYTEWIWPEGQGRL